MVHNELYLREYLDKLSTYLKEYKKISDDLPDFISPFNEIKNYSNVLEHRPDFKKQIEYLDHLYKDLQQACSKLGNQFPSFN